MALRKRKDEHVYPSTSESGMWEVLDSFACDLDHVPYVAVRGEVYASDHILVREHPELFVPFGLDDPTKTEIRQKRQGGMRR